MNPRSAALVIAASTLSIAMAVAMIQQPRFASAQDQLHEVAPIQLAYGPGNGDCHEDGRKVDCPAEEAPEAQEEPENTGDGQNSADQTEAGESSDGEAADGGDHSEDDDSFNEADESDDEELA